MLSPVPYQPHAPSYDPPPPPTHTQTPTSTILISRQTLSAVAPEGDIMRLPAACGWLPDSAFNPDSHRAEQHNTMECHLKTRPPSHPSGINTTYVTPLIACVLIGYCASELQKHRRNKTTLFSTMVCKSWFPLYRLYVARGYSLPFWF